MAKDNDDKTLLVTTETDNNLRMTWTGTNSGDWDLGTQNWENRADNTDSTFLDGDLIYFTAAGANQNINILHTQVSVAGMAITGGARVVLDTNNGAIDTGSFGDGMAIANAGVLTFNRTNAAADAYEQKGMIAGAGQVIKEGNGRVVFSGGNAYTGPTKINDGTLALTNVGAAGQNTNAHVVENDATLELSFTTSGDNAFNQKITGTGDVVKTGAFKATLTNSDSDYSGQTVVEAGTLALTHVNATGSNNASTSV